MVTSNGFHLLPNATSFLVKQTPYRRLSSPWPVTAVSHSRYGWKAEWFLSWRDTERIPDFLLHDTERDQLWSRHHGGCALAAGTRVLWDHRDPNSVDVAGSRGRNCHQSKNNSPLFPSTSYPLVVAFGLHPGTQQCACKELTNQPTNHAAPAPAQSFHCKQE